MSNLVWSPVYDVIEKQIGTGDNLILIIVPFAKLDALKQLHWVQSGNVRLKIVCRWLPSDLLSGASDLEVFTYLKANGCELYINPNIHLKLYVFESNTAFNTSGNLTLKGLGYSGNPNIEVGNMVPLTKADWISIFKIIKTSRQVDEVLYKRFKAFLESQLKEKVPVPAPDLVGPPKVYTIASLPASETPAQLAKFYCATIQSVHDPEEVRRCIHDLVTFDIPPGLSALEFDVKLGDAFRKTPFVRDFVSYLQSEKNLRFGAVNEWIHRTCEDVPLPYRWEIKENTRIFYNWLTHFFPEISWDRPNHSQVIYWGKM